ncbi:phosphomethylpyrimidine synthase [bacterium]|nr:MAG: phosphomethylpyrimidine synthase [bacterium]
MTLIERARRGEITEEIKIVAEEEGINPELLKDRIARGEAIIPKNKKRELKRLVGIGKGLRTKINANVGTSSDYTDPEEEVKKAKVAEEAGADTVMDLSTGGDLREIRRRIIQAVGIPVGTVPIYQAAVEAARKGRGIVTMTEDDMFRVIEEHAKDGVDFMTVHVGVTLSTLERLKNEGRIMDVVSRGGAFLLVWMIANEKENPLYEKFDRLIEIAREYEVTLSLGDGFRPGALLDATDRSQLQELILLGELAQRAQDAGVQVMIEGPGHVPIHQIEMNIKLEKEICHGAPFYVLGPVVTDIAPGYDHITSAIGGAIAAAAGADFLCYVTPSEHLSLPDAEEVREGVIAAKIAAHAGDLAKGIPSAWEKEKEMGIARKKLDWKKQFSVAIDPEKAKKIREKRSPSIPEVCTMCGKYCAIRLLKEALKK